jgi:hypothetical protein
LNLSYSVCKVYGDQIAIVYRMGGVFNDFDDWREKYGKLPDPLISPSGVGS